MKIYNSNKGFKFSAWLAITFSPIARSVIKPSSDDDLIIMQTSTPELNQLVTLKSTTENGKFKFFIISTYLKNYAKEVEGTINQQNYFVYITKGIYEEYLNKNKIMEIGNATFKEPKNLSSRYFATGSYKSLLINPFTKRIIISGEHLKISPTFNIVHKKMYLPYLEKLEQQTIENVIDGAKTTISSKKQQLLRFYYYSIFPLDPDTEIVFCVDSDVYNVPQYELIKHMVGDHKDMTDPSSTVSISLQNLNQFRIIPF